MTLREEIINLSEAKYSKKPTRAEYREKLDNLGNQEFKDYDEMMYGDGDKKVSREKWEASQKEYEDAKAHNPYRKETQKILNKINRENNKCRERETRTWNRETCHLAGLPKTKKKYKKQSPFHISYKVLG